MVGSKLRSQPVNNENLQQIRTRLHESGILAEVRPGEVLIMILPSARLLAGRFAILLVHNGVGCRAIGHGSGRVQDSLGEECQTQGILVLAVLGDEVRKVELYAKLFGVTAIPLGGLSRTKKN
jgi:hypothetical protein